MSATDLRPLAMALAAAVLVASAPPAAAQHGASTAAPSSTANLQGDQRAWMNDPHWRSYYEMTRATFAGGAAKVDVTAFEQRSFGIFREFAIAKGIDPAMMQDHLKLIPRQMVQIVKEDPHVLDSYDNFIAAGFGPR
jgi:hypothetical protein